MMSPWASGLGTPEKSPKSLRNNPTHSPDTFQSLFRNCSQDFLESFRGPGARGPESQKSEECSLESAVMPLVFCPFQNRVFCLAFVVLNKSRCWWGFCAVRLLDRGSQLNRKRVWYHQVHEFGETIHDSNTRVGSGNNTNGSWTSGTPQMEQLSWPSRNSIRGPQKL